MALKQIKTSELKKDDRFYTNLGKTQEYVCISTSPLRACFYCEKPPVSVMVQALTIDTVYVEVKAEPAEEPDMTIPDMAIGEGSMVQCAQCEAITPVLLGPSATVCPRCQAINKERREADEPDVVELVELGVLDAGDWFEFESPETHGLCCVIETGGGIVGYMSTKSREVNDGHACCKVRRIPNPIIAGQEAIEQRDKLVAALRNDEMADEMVKRCGSLASLPNLIFAEYRYNVLSAADIEKAEVE